MGAKKNYTSSIFIEDIINVGGPMRCPRCAYKGKLFQGRCAVCGYPLEQETEENGTAAVHQTSIQVSEQYSPITNHYALIPDFQLIDNRRSNVLEPGNTLRSGRYRLQERIALPPSQQNHGQAWNAYDLQMSSRFVVIHEIKFFSDVASPAVQKEYIANKIAQRLNRLGEHPSLPRVSDMFSENEAYFLVFLYPQGETLASLLKSWSNGLPEYMIAEYAWQLCDVLTLLGEQQPPIVHGAISPETILISEEGRQAILMHLPLLPPKETVGKIDDIGSSYRAPEQVHGIITPASDLYSLAATLYHAVTGSAPHERPPAFYPPARRLNETVSLAMELILARQLRLTVTQRYNNPHEMKQDLASLLESYATQATRAVVPFQSSEMPLLSIKDEKGEKIGLKNMKIIVPTLIGILVVLGLLLVIILHT
jgi:serine/threonine protein kinase